MELEILPLGGLKKGVVVNSVQINAGFANNANKTTCMKILIIRHKRFTNFTRFQGETCNL